MIRFTGLVLLGGLEWSWLRFAEGILVEQGAGLPDRGQGEAVAAVYPAAETTIFQGVAAGLPRAQAIAIAQRQAAETVLSPVHDLHFAAGDHVAAVDRDRFAAWLADLAEAGLDPAPVVPAQLVPDMPESGFVRLRVGEEDVLRGAEVACAWDPAFGGTITGVQPVTDLPEEMLAEQVAQAIDRKEVDLRQGSFAPATSWDGARQFLRAVAVLAGLLLAFTVMTPLMLAVRLHGSAQEINASADELARTVVAKEEPEPQAALERRMAGLRGPGQGFGPTAAAVLSAVKASKGATLAAFGFDSLGVARATIQAPTDGDLDTIGEALRAYGFRVNRGPTSTVNSQRRTAFEVRVK